VNGASNVVHRLNLTQRPQRWDAPFGEQMTDELVDLLLSIEPFSLMDESGFPESVSLRGILKNDARIVDYQQGDIIIREGEYGSSAFMILEGTADVCLKSLPAELLGRATTRKRTFWESLSQIWNSRRVAEMRDPRAIRATPASDQLGQRVDQQGITRIFLQDIPRVLDENQQARMVSGEVFGELAALARTPRSATVIATAEKTRLLEIRWQGLRDIIRRDSALRKHIDDLYRQNSLNVHLRETPLLANLDNETVTRIADATIFETHGQFDWQHKFIAATKKQSADILRAEPVIVKQGDYPDGLILIRNGFARMTRLHGSSEQTLSYLGKGSIYGLDELAHNYRSPSSVGWQSTLRAVGYVDILRIPTTIVEACILPQLNSLSILKMDVNQPAATAQLSATNTQPASQPSQLETGLLEFLVEHRFMNGTQAMLIDLNRCTRCDDCVRACASTHDNNPRFVRSGPKHDHLMIANACMHCVDPVCMIGCPTGAIHRNFDNGAVTIHESTCIGCGTCANSCPYDNIKMVGIRDKRGAEVRDAETALPILKATKCDLCAGQSTGPACQNACPHEALLRIDISDPQSLSEFFKTS
jgi:Fe-S-cluster-containing dehydrogenase component/CRP-like cAMP-binding protein